MPRRGHLRRRGGRSSGPRRMTRLSAVTQSRADRVRYQTVGWADQRAGRGTSTGVLECSTGEGGKTRARDLAYWRPPCASRPPVPPSRSCRAALSREWTHSQRRSRASPRSCASRSRCAWARNVEIPITMPIAAIQESIKVSGESPLVDSKTMGTSTKFTQDELAKIPTSRDPWALLRTVPGVIPVSRSPGECPA